MAEELRRADPASGQARIPLAAYLGAAILVVAVVTWAAVRHARETPWKDNAITAQFANLTVKKGQRSVHLILTYRLTNNTGDQYRLPPPGSSELMRKSPSGQMKEVDSVLWDQDTPVPAHGTAVEEFDISEDPLHYDLDLDDLDTHDKLTEFVDQRLARIRGLEFSDYIHHYNIELPKGWQ